MRVLNLLLFTLLLGMVVAEDDLQKADLQNAEKKYTDTQRLLDCNQIKREVDWDVSNKKATLKVKVDKEERKEGKTKGLKCNSDLDVDIELKDGEGLRTKMSLKAQNGDAKVRFEFRMHLEEIVEFVDSNTAIQGYDANDTIIQVYSIGRGMNGADGKLVSNELWNNLPGSIPLDPDNAGCYSFAADTANGTFAAVTRYCKVPQVSFTKDSGREWVNKYNITKNLTLSYNLSPNAVKFDFLINKFPYKQSDTKLAFRGRLVTKSSFKVKHLGKILTRPDMDEIDIGGGAGGFSWATKAFADGAEVKVIVTNGKDGDGAVSGEQSKRYAWTFDKIGKVDSFIWDPEMVGDMGGILGGNAATGLAPGLFALAVSLFLFLF